MRHVRRWRADDGSAALEVATMGFILLVPLVYLVVVIGAIQSAALAAEGAARQAARVVTLSTTDAAARDAAERAVTIALEDADVAGATVDVTLSCSPRPDRCVTRQGTVTVAVALDVPLPLVPAVYGAVPPSVPLEARSTQRVSRFHVTE
jgi:Flp pilus assembly protein TadG